MRVGRVNGALKFTFDILTLRTYGDRLPVTRSFDQLSSPVSIPYTLFTVKIPSLVDVGGEEWRGHLQGRARFHGARDGVFRTI